ncbi:2Fe-2S iron-sulfur cluster-binding protein [Hydrogenophaga sp.]|uniref:2Fe-2S iron-sulfur cluster-binding protein n=1 Tax=Hydrogenophaga sp. TaxID=1904254 RepID=UPI003F71F70D
MNHSIAIEATEVTFDNPPGQSLLDAALRAGIELPYSCRKGVCGSCVGSIASGEVRGLNGAAIRNDTCGPDQVLYCLCEPTTDVVLQPASWKRVDPSARKTLTAKVYSNQLAAPDVSVLRLRLPAGQRAKFQAGQYLQILLEDGSARCYSMANPPHESDGATLHIRHVAGGQFSQRVAQLAPGDPLRIELPFGNVALASEDTRPIVFVAGGTGFAPVKSILDDMLKKRVQRDITLIWGAREPAGLYLRSAVERWQKQWPDFRFIAALSDVPSDDAFAGRADDALRQCCAALGGHVVYCCGSPPMVSAVRSAAAEKGLAPEDFHADVFVPGPSAAPA